MPDEIDRDQEFNERNVPVNSHFQFFSAMQHRGHVYSLRQKHGHSSHDLAKNSAYS